MQYDFEVIPKYRKSAKRKGEGDVYNRRKVEDGLKRLYDIGAFGEYNGPSPRLWELVELKTDEENGRVEVLIRVL